MEINIVAVADKEERKDTERKRKKGKRENVREKKER